VLAIEARRQGTTLARLLAQAVRHEADRLRHGQTPWVGTFRADVGIAAAMGADADDPAARPFR
jgi:hypothetical protein